MKRWVQKRSQHVFRDLGKHVRLFNQFSHPISSTTNQDDPSKPKNQLSYRPLEDKSQRLHILHLYRALLRECTYLPHPPSRPIISSHLSTLFHRHTRYPSSSSTSQHLRTRHIHHAHRTLLSLRRANHGHTTPLQKILSLTYARSGARRWSLLSPLTIPYETLDNISISITHTTTNSTTMETIPKLMPQLHALIRSQGPGTGKRRRVFRTLLPEIEEMNIWGREMPISRVRNKVRKWYRDVLDRIKVPLPKEEWEGLRAAVLGDEQIEGERGERGGRRRRRKMARFEGEKEVWEFKREVVTVTGAETYKNMRGISRPHALTGRYMRRMLMRVLEQCPMMEEVDGEWKVKWFDEKEDERSGIRYKGTRMMGREEMFEGVDDRGRIIGSERPEETKKVKKRRKWVKVGD